MGNSVLVYKGVVVKNKTTIKEVIYVIVAPLIVLVIYVFAFICWMCSGFDNRPGEDSIN